MHKKRIIASYGCYYCIGVMPMSWKIALEGTLGLLEKIGDVAIKTTSSLAKEILKESQKQKYNPETKIEKNIRLV